MFEEGDEFHDGIDTEPHGVEIEDIGVFFGVDFGDGLFEHFGFFLIGFITGVLTAGVEEF